MADFGSLSPDWLQGVYQQLLGRGADDGGRDYYLNSGMDQSGVWDALSNSSEGRTYESGLLQQSGAPTDWLSLLKEDNPLLNVQNAAGKLRTDFGQLSPQDLDMMVRGIYGEARNQGDEGQLAVLNTMLNRWMLNGNQVPDTERFSPNMQQELLKHYDALDPRKGGDNYKEAMGLNADDPSYQAIMRMIQGRFGGQLQDNTRGATHYLNPTAQMQLYKSMPGWYAPFQTRNRVQIGDHVFVNQIPESFYDQSQRPGWFDPSKLPIDTNRLGPNINMGSNDAPPDSNLGAFDGLRTTQAGFTPQVMGQDGYTSTGANIIPATAYNGLNSSLINAGYNGQGGGYSSGVSPATNPFPANPFPNTAFAGSGIAPPTFQPNTQTFGGSATTPGTDMWGTLTPTFNFTGGDYLGF
jgi:N-acetylmuramoyl-L-alanine amidase